MSRLRAGIALGVLVLATLPVASHAQPAMPLPAAGGCGPGGGTADCSVGGSDTTGGGRGSGNASGNNDDIIQDEVNDACQVVWDFDGDGAREGTDAPELVPPGWTATDTTGCVIVSPEGETFTFRVRLNAWVQDEVIPGPPPTWCVGYNPDGRWWRGVVGGTSHVQNIWGDNVTSEGVCPTPGDPGQMAETVVEAWINETLTSGDIALTPPADNPDSMAIVGHPVWMWFDNPSLGTVGSEEPIVVEEGTVRVTLDVKVDSVDFDMGDGNVVTCHYNPETGTVGTPYTEGADLDSSDCSHVYESTSAGQDGDEFTITATTNWDVTWSVETSGGLDEGQENPQVDPSSTTLRVAEVQTIRTN